MNDPRRDPLEELRWAARHGFRAFDLTLEAPQALPERFPAGRFRDLAGELGFEVLGHTAWYLPFGSPVERLRRAAVEELCGQLPVFHAAGVHRVNVHPYPGTSGLEDRRRAIERVSRSFSEIAARAEDLGLEVMVENLPGFSEPRQMSKVLRDGRLRFHLDVAHASVGKECNEGLLQRFGDRLIHVHLSDNSTERDDHLPLGAGKVPWKKALQALKRRGYRGAITLEVFTPDRELLLFSRDRLLAAWND